MSKITPRNERFAEILGGLFFDLLRAGGVSMQPAKAQERIREVGRRAGAVIEFHAERKAVEVARKLQTAVKEAFDAMEDDIKIVKKQNIELNERVKLLESAIGIITGVGITTGVKK